MDSHYYTATSSSRYATGYTVTADYTGVVVKNNCDVVTYTTVFGSMELPEEEQQKQNRQQTVERKPAHAPAGMGGLFVFFI